MQLLSHFPVYPPQNQVWWEFFDSPLPGCSSRGEGVGRSIDRSAIACQPGLFRRWVWQPQAAGVGAWRGAALELELALEFGAAGAGVGRWSWAAGGGVSGVSAAWRRSFFGAGVGIGRGPIMRASGSAGVEVRSSFATGVGSEEGPVEENPRNTD